MPRDNIDQDDPTIIKDDTPFPDPQLYFKVFDSEKDEPDAKYRQDVLKLYERWEQKYGRKWPENGLNTEDLVWLYEEAYKDEAHQQEAAAAGPIVARRRRRGAGAGGSGAGGSSGGGGTATATPRRQRTVPLEDRLPDDELMTATEDAVDSALASLPADPKAAAAAIAAAKDAVAAANWVTDEFESEDYEQGNMELLHGAYLWDQGGQPTVMPSEPPAEEMGEQSENWDDFYGSVRPRHVDSDEARDALWVTDEFESDEDNTESEWEPEYVGAGLGLAAEDPINPQYSLRHSNHPLAPFPGEPLKWASYVYDDGTSYEGLTRDAIAHGMGVLVMGNGTGGGFQLRSVRRGDKYEGEFQAGYAHGLGQFTSPTSGEVYIGEFFAGQRHGCGVKIDMSPFYYLLERGDDPVSAYRRTYDRIMRNIEFRTWYRDTPLGDNNEDEAVLYTVRRDLDNPWDTVTRNLKHEAKLRDWQGLSAEEKALSRMVDILDMVERQTGRAYKGGGAEGLYKGYGNNISVAGLGPLGDEASDGETATGDSIDLQVGNTTDGGVGFGWFDDTLGSTDFPMDDTLAQQIANDVAEDRLEEDDDKEAVLGDDILNPTTGLSVKDYLEGKEGEYNELLVRRYGSKGLRLIKEDNDELSDFDEEQLRALRASNPRLGNAFEAELLANMRAYDALAAEDDPHAPPSRRADKDWAAEDTETRFETESDMMEMCDLAEIIGTIDEVEEIVARARMWRWKPYGEATIRLAQDAVGAPVELMQDPLHYPHGTKWMAPGPMGQVHPLPDDKSIRIEMARAAKNYAHVYSLYNFDWDPEPGSIQWKVDGRIQRSQQLQLRRFERMAAEAEAAEAAEAGGGVQPGQLLAAADDVSGASPAGGVRALQQWAAPGGGGGGGGRLASMTLGGLGVGRASRAVLNTLARAAKRAPTLQGGRPRLARPQRSQAVRQQQQGRGTHQRAVVGGGGRQQQ